MHKRKIKMHKMNSSSYYSTLEKYLVQSRTRGHVNAITCTMHTQATLIYASMSTNICTHNNLELKHLGI